ncbi:DsbE family thiol:disulfide interchange protein [Leucothrix arctica]|uniref:DsbE family thiol:disulfide interchange protein n=1 Tax=Leucothrix arctica TaxID=1481894 RepID=A0A317C914_9GAMM|nr:DsbE family thiol:disulfide interchange protein [Leucothrix arctica]PWQ94998.1 DsbE family thiol:disulfide interchange protein [Leucothrix arctica]
MKKSALIPLAVFAVLVVFLGVGLGLKPREVPSPFIGKPVPQFVLPELMKDGKTISPADLKGQVWMLNVFASWCFACRAEHEVLSAFINAEKIPVVGLNYKDEAEDAKNWLAALGNPYQHIAFDYKGDVGIDYGVYGVPETFVIDKKGIIRHKQIGPVFDETVVDTLLPLVLKLREEKI